MRFFRALFFGFFHSLKWGIIVEAKLVPRLVDISLERHHERIEVGLGADLVRARMHRREECVPVVPGSWIAERHLHVATALEHQHPALAHEAELRQHATRVGVLVVLEHHVEPVD
jgi:hypothetical protein